MAFDVAQVKELYPWQGHRLDVGGGVRMHYLDTGKGEPLVMVHGNPTWSFFFRDLIRGVEGDFRVIAPDHVGCGLSDKPNDERYEYVLERRLKDLEALLDHLKLTRGITLVLHDWGGMIGLAYAVRHPERISRLVLLNTAGFSLPAGKLLPWQVGVVRHLKGFQLPVRAFNAFSRGAVATCSVRPGRMTPQVRRGYLGPYDSWAHRIAVQRFVEDIPLGPKDRSWDLVQEVTRGLPKLAHLPTLVCWGAQDFVFDAAFLAEWKKHLPGAEFHEFKDAGHYVLDDAHEQIVPLVRAFLAKHPVKGA
jgi:haloalkane dehalogenase